MCRGKVLIPVIFCLILAYSNVYGQYQWNDLNGPYWASGIDVACGTHDQDNNHYWYRYLVGSNGNEIRPFYWNTNSTKWLPADDPRPYANKIISYNSEPFGNNAVCSAYGVDIYRSFNGGASWSPTGFGFTNNRFSAVEVEYLISNDQHKEIFVGANDYLNQPTTFIYHYYNGQDQWDVLGQADGNDPIYRQKVTDIECDHFGELFAATDIGLFKRNTSDNLTAAWQATSISGDRVMAVEDINCFGSGAQQVAAVAYTNPVSHKLWYSPNRDYFASPVEIQPNNNSFDHEVTDLAALRWDGVSIQKISCYATTPDGLYLIYFNYSNGSASPCQEYDIKEIPTADGFYPMKYDKNFVAVDYNYLHSQGSTYDTALVLAATPYNIYQITEVRENDDSHDLVDIQVSDCVDGTYLSNIVSAAFPSNQPEDRKIYTVSDNGLVKEYNGMGSWQFISLSFNNALITRINFDTLPSIIIDPENENNIIKATAPSVTPPHFWASGDSGRSWIELPLGDIPIDAHINKLVASNNNDFYLLAFTDKGVYAIGDIFRFSSFGR